MKIKPSSLIVWLVTICLVVFLIAGCALINKPGSEKERPEKAPVSEKFQTAPEEAQKKTLVSGLPEAEEALSSGAYSHALEVYQSFLEKNPAEDKIRADYLKALELVKREADNLKKREKYHSALFYYRLLFKHSQQLGQEATTLSFKPADLQSEIKECQIRNQKAEAEKAFKSGQFETAINFLLAGLKEYPDEEILTGSLAQIVEGILSQANQAQTTKDWAMAGRLYSILKSLGINHKKYLTSFPLSLEEIEKSIKNCSQQLTNEGLREYRRGNLKEAIAIWEKILAFQPENEEIKRAIQTARAQQEKIKKQSLDFI